MLGLFSLLSTGLRHRKSDLADNVMTYMAMLRSSSCSWSELRLNIFRSDSEKNSQKEPPPQGCLFTLALLGPIKNCDNGAVGGRYDPQGNMPVLSREVLDGDL